MQNQSVTNGRLTLDDLLTSMNAGDIDTLIVAFADMQGRLVGKRLTRRYVQEHLVHGGVHFCVYLLATDMEMSTPAGFPGLGWEEGYGDWMAKPDWGTLRRIPWLERTALVLADVETATGSLVEVAPRTILKRQLDRARAHGFSVQLASELEFYVLQDSYEEAAEKKWSKLRLAGTYNEDYQLLQATRNEPLYRQFRDGMESAGIPIEGTKGEAGVGQHEINVAYADALEACDRHVLLKHGMKEMAIQNGCSLTFMAKPDHTWTGSSSHFHVSIWDDDVQNNLFCGADHSDVAMSPLMEHFLAGVVLFTRELTLLSAPFVNSYKRYAKASWAPTHIVWGMDNRTCGLRIVGSGAAKRIENRFPGADTNPYLAAAAMIGAGLTGVDRSLRLPPMWQGNAYEAGDAATLPTSLYEAIAAFTASETAKAILGEQVHQHYLRAAQVEQQTYDAVVTEWEKARYFERV